MLQLQSYRCPFSSIYIHTVALKCALSIVWVNSTVLLDEVPTESQILGEVLPTQTMETGLRFMGG